MGSRIIENFRKYGYESFILLIVFSLSWLGHGDPMWGLLIVAFLAALIFKKKRAFIFRDKLILVLVIALVCNNVISSLFAIDRLKSTLLSAVFFIAIFIPMSYVRFSLNRDNDFFTKWILPVSFVISLIILLYLYSSFLYHFLNNTMGQVKSGRFTFYNLGTASTPDFVLLLSGLGYGWIRQKQGKRYPWLALVYLLACTLGMLIAFDRGGVMAFFIMALILLSFDYKRLLVFLGIIAVIVVLITTVDAFSRMERMIDYLYSQATRKELLLSEQISTFKAAWEMAADYWLLGVGTNNFSEYSSQYGPKIGWAYAHNVILQWWAENGIFGMLLNLGVVGVVIGRWARSFKRYKYKYVALGIGASFIAHFIGNLTNSTIYIVKIGLMFYLLAGLMSAVYFSVKDSRDEAEAN
jgi:O-antigen ligase